MDWRCTMQTRESLEAQIKYKNEYIIELKNSIRDLLAQLMLCKCK